MRNLFTHVSIISLAILLSCPSIYAQNVGIGNASPTSRLDVIGNNSSDTLFHVQTAGEVSRLVVLKNGRIGIGTKKPKTKFEVQDGSLLLDAKAQYGGDYAIDNDDYSDALIVGGKGAESGLKIFKQAPGSSKSFIGINKDRDSYVFEMTDGNNNDPDGGVIFAGTGKDDKFEDIMTVRGNGNVGIGTTIPKARMVVQGKSYIFNGKNEDARLGRGASEHLSIEVQDDHAFLDYEQNSDNDGDHTFYVRNRASGTGTNDIRFRTGSSNGLTIADNGNVGIHRKYPNETLHVTGSQAWSIPSGGYLVLDGAIGGSNASDFRNFGGDIRFSAGDQSSGSGHIRFYTNQRNERMTITDGGKVGIGTTNPAHRLHIKDNHPLKLEAFGEDWGFYIWGNNGKNLNITSENDASGSRLHLQRDVPNGKVTVGASAGGNELQVSGDAKVSGDTKIDGGLFGNAFDHKSKSKNIRFEWGEISHDMQGGREKVTFDQSFNSNAPFAPKVFVTIQTQYGSEEATIAHAEQVGYSDFYIRAGESETTNGFDGNHTSEEIAWFAIGPK
ncbi:MAG: hypothetical protein BRD50_05925 [Bacteroidetes bacterium SW_11_45_7]|nr:MAG: hypothetical protein BRD50_05925 [Bacteroidetes bacterium SW_11_45_7]